ncbi:MAG: glycosyltransferase family 39 protein [Gemmatimonadaceae bacterium]
MTTHSSDTHDARPPFAVGIVATVVAVSLALHVITLMVTTFGIQRDEFLYFSMGEHLRLWRMDFPPLIAILANIAGALPGHTLAAVRVFPAVEGAALTLLAALIGRELGGGRFAQGLTALCCISSVLFQRTSTLFQPVVLDQLWWTLALWMLVRLSREERPRDWIGFGIAMGLGLLTKFSILFFGLAALGAIVVTPARRWLLTPWPWLAAAIAFVIGAPSIVGQVRLGYPVVAQMRDLQGQQLGHVSWLSFVAEQPLMVSPAPFVVAVIGVVALIATHRARRFAVAGWACLLAFALLLVLHGKAYYIGPIYPTLFAAGAVVVEAWRARWATAARWSIVAVTIAFGALLLPLGMPLLGWGQTGDYIARIGASSSLRTNQGVMERLPQDYADMIGWEEQSQALARATRALSAGEREAAVILGANYGEAGAAEFYRAKYDLPPVVSSVGSFWFFGPGARPGTVLVSIGADSVDIAKFYDDVRVAEVVRSPWSVAEEREVPVLVARRPRTTLQAIWPSLAGRQ